jgi:hypothetical protein
MLHTNITDCILSFTLLVNVKERPIYNYMWHRPLYNANNDYMLYILYVYWVYLRLYIIYKLLSYIFFMLDSQVDITSVD